MIGGHLSRSKSKTQAVVAKSSGESELCGIVRESIEGLEMTTLLKDFGVTDSLVSIGIDATADMSMAQRVGLNKVRHVEVDIFWIQEQQARKLLPLRKIPGPRSGRTSSEHSPGVIAPSPAGVLSARRSAAPRGHRSATGRHPRKRDA